MKQRVAVLGNKGAPEGVALILGLAALVVLFGVLGLLDGSWVEQILGSRINVRAMFGLFLCTLVAVRFHGRLKCGAPMLQTDICDLSRELSRMVYLSLYMVIGVRQIIGIADWLRPAGVLEFGKFAADEDLQAIVAYGLVGLLLIRALAFGFWLHWSRSGVTAIDGAVLSRASGRNFEEM
jgi:cytochrome b561